MTRGYSAVGLYAPKTDANVGGALRAAACYGASLVAIQGRKRVRYATDTHRTWRHTPVLFAADIFDAVPFGCVPVAVEIVPSALPLIHYKHPERAFYVFGPEDGSIPQSALSRCRDAVEIPMVRGLCMNLAATVNVVLYDRLAKRGEA